VQAEAPLMPPVRAEVAEVPPRPALVTVPSVEILEVGEDWHTSTGDFTFTVEDLQAAVDAQSDPAVRSPVVKLGHVDPRFDGEPALGRLSNLRVENEGQTLVADLVGVPRWLADIMASAFPSRSIEGAYNVTTTTGQTHNFMIDALALLGVAAPAIGTLEDIAGLFGIDSVAAAERPQEGGTHVVLLRRTTLPLVPPVRVDAAVTTEDVRRAYYESLDGSQTWWWIREVQIDPAALIVDDDEGSLHRIAYTISGDDVTFAEPEEVRIEYVAAAGAEPRAATVIFASAAESRPEGLPMDLSRLRIRLGLPETATDAEVMAAAEEALPDPAPEADAETTSESTAPAPPPVVTEITDPAPADASPVVPEGAVLVDASTLAQLQAQAGQGAAAAATLRQRDRAAFIGRVAGSGRLAPANGDLRASLEREWDRDPVAAERVAAQLAVVVPLDELGHELGAEPEATAGGFDAMDDYLFPEVASVRARQNGATGG
jgi:hypothetical protein